MTRRRRLGAIAAALGIAGVVFAPGARADGPTKDECINANDAAQTARQDGKLREAKKQLLVCVAKSCPTLVRDDCTERMTDVEKAIPTVVFAATDAQGNDLSDVRVTVDGEALAERLDGTPVAVDPGAHVFRFEAAGGGGVTKKVVVRETEKGRRISIAFGANAAATDAAKGQPDSGEQGPSAAPSRWPAYVAFAGAGIGVAIGVVFTLMAISEKNDETAAANDCMSNPLCSVRTHQGMQDQANANAANSSYNVDLGVAVAGYGVAALGIGIGTYFLLKSGADQPADRAKGASGVTVVPWVGFGSGGIGGRF